MGMTAKSNEQYYWFAIYLNMSNQPEENMALI